VGNERAMPCISLLAFPMRRRQSVSLDQTALCLYFAQRIASCSVADRALNPTPCLLRSWQALSAPCECLGVARDGFASRGIDGSVPRAPNPMQTDSFQTLQRGILPVKTGPGDPSKSTFASRTGTVQAPRFDKPTWPRLRGSNGRTERPAAR
jgi:hypothetical protein